MELLQHGLQLCGNRQAEVGCVFHEGDSFIGQVKENDGGPKYTRCAENLQVHQMADTDQHKDQDLFEDTRKPISEDSFLSTMAHMIPVR